MQSYRQEENQAGPSNHAVNSAGLSGAMNRREDEIGKYKDRYEESMNPFEAFKGRVGLLRSVFMCRWS